MTWILPTDQAARNALMARDSRPWIKVSVDMWRHPKIGQLTAAQFKTLIALWSLAMEYQTDGVLDVKFVRSQGLRSASLKAIADTGLMSFSDDGQTLTLHDYLDHQMSAEQLAARTNQRRSAGRRGGLAKAAKAHPDGMQEALLGAEYKPYSARNSAPTRRGVGPQVEALQNGETAGHAESDCTGTLQHTRGHARAAEGEREEENLPPNAAAYRPSTRETEQQQPATHWADDVPIPPEPPADPTPSLALVHDADAAPAVIDAHRPPPPGKPSDAALALVRSIVPRAVGRQIIEQLAREVDKLGRDRDVNRTDIAAALTEWTKRPGAGPRLLPNLVADAARACAIQASPRETSAMNHGREYIEIGERLAQRLEAQQSTTTGSKELR